jgi:uncharacterized protein YjhX (UPF0386 family)
MASIKGIVIPAAWDQNGKIISLAIATDDEQEYIIETRQIFTKLKSLLREEVVVTGTIRQTEKNKIIEVKSYSRRQENMPKI